MAQGNNRSNVNSHPGGLPPFPLGYNTWTPPAAPEPRRITNDDVSLYGELRRYLMSGIDDENKPIVLDLTCLICSSRRLAVPSELNAPLDEGDEGTEALAVLPCGHWFGHDCILTWIINSETRIVPPVCPICRFLLQHPVCRHRITTRTAEEPEAIPLTLPEGGMVNPLCPACIPVNFIYNPW
ncbi:hypothetical protein AAE478_000080 [Parahypoxylon ruwenzoriense]